MRAARLFILMLLALSAFGPRCAVAAIGSPAAHSGHGGAQQHRSHHDGAACESPCVGCAVAPVPAPQAGGPYMFGDAPDPMSAPAASPTLRIASLDPPPPRTA